MARALSVVVAIAALACYEPTPPAQRVWENQVDSLEGLRDEVREAVHFDPTTSFDRNGSLVVETRGDSSFLLFVLEGDALRAATLENAQISYQAHVRTSELDGEANIELRVRLPGDAAEGETYQAVPDMPPLKGSTDWVLQEANFFTKAGESPTGIFLMLGVKGAGRVWIDHLKVLSTPRPR